MMRQDPPFDMAYITATHILEKLPVSTLVINNPSEVRNSPEKIFVTNFSHLMPKTIITRNFNVIENFRNDYNDIIINHFMETVDKVFFIFFLKMKTLIQF